MGDFYRSNICTVDIAKPLDRCSAGIVLATGDCLANRFGAILYRDGVPVDTTGAAVTGYFIRPDGDTVVCEGVADGNAVYVDLPAACYTQDGTFSLAIKVSNTEITQTVRVVDGCIRLTQTDTLVDPGEVVPSVDKLLAIVADVEAAASPIVAETSGAVATIADAAARDVQGLVTTITAAQAGEGTPSPSNVRAISPHDSVSLYHGAAYDESATPVHTAALPEAIYGGTLDWTTGVLTVTHYMIMYDGTEDWTFAPTNAVCSLKDMPARLLIGNQEVHHICSHYRSRKYATGASQTDKTCYTLNTTTLMIKDTALTSLEDWTGYLAAQAAAGTPMTIVWRLKPSYYKTIQLTPQQLTLLKGNNALWSDTGDTSVTYTADTKMYIDNKFTALQNAILAQGANI